MFPKETYLGYLGQQSRNVDVNVGDTSLKEVIVGGAEFEWSPSRIDLSRDNKLVIYMYYNGFPSTSESVLNAYDQISTNKDKPGFIKPQFAAI